MIDENQKVNDFLEDLWKISKKHGIWLGKYPHFGASMNNEKEHYLGYCWPVHSAGKYSVDLVFKNYEQKLAECREIYERKK